MAELAISASPSALALRAHLEGLTALDMMRCQALVSPPRGLALVVGCAGILVGLAEAVPDWEGCQKLLQGEPVRPKGWRPPRGRSSQAELASGSKSLLQRLREFDDAAPGAAAQQT
eukprot:4072468-Prymnesium_polylepis.1